MIYKRSLLNEWKRKRPILGPETYREYMMRQCLPSAPTKLRIVRYPRLKLPSV